MKKDLNWLKKEIATEITELEPNRKEKWSDVKYQTLRSVAQKICQLDEPKILSQEWIDKNVVHVRGLGDIVEAEVIENLLVPKQEITEKQVMNWLDKNDFYDHITAETVLERAVDKGELSYYGTKYSVIEAPIIPKYVADYLEFAKKDASLIQVMETASIINHWITMKKEYDWISDNDEMFARAWLNGYTVEAEPLYYAMVKGHELLDDVAKYWAHNKYDSEDLFISYETRDDSPIIVKNTKNHWVDLGINDSNADFIKVV